MFLQYKFFKKISFLRGIRTPTVSKHNFHLESRVSSVGHWTVEKYGPKLREH
jgi:hypothetical protein